MTLQELHDYLYDSKTPRNPRLFIDNYEKNFVVINNADLTSLTEYDYAMRLTCDYAISLESNGYLKKGIEYNESLSIFKELDRVFPNKGKICCLKRSHFGYCF